MDKVIEIDENGKVHLPPSDAAPRACVDCGASVPHGGVGGGTTYWRSIPCPNGRPGCLVGHGEQVCRACAHPEDAPGGPWEARKTGATWLVGKTRSIRRLVGLTEAEAIAVRDALNRLKGEGETDG